MFVFQIIQEQIDTSSKLQLMLYTIVVGTIGTWACMVSFTFPYNLGGGATPDDSLS